MADLEARQINESSHKQVILQGQVIVFGQRPSRVDQISDRASGWPSICLNSSEWNFF